MRLSLRYQLALTLVVVNVALTAGVALTAYRAAHDAMVDEALHSVSLVAQSRERELIDMLQHKQERLDGFLQSLQVLCGEASPSGGYGFERECVRAAVGGFHRSERALSIEVAYGGRRLEHIGPAQRVPDPVPGSLVRIDAVAGKGDYSMGAALDALAVHTEFALDDVNAIFEDRAGIEDGEAFLTDAAGYRLTSVSRASASQHPVMLAPLVPCTRGSAQATQTTDDRGVDVIAGLRPAAGIAAGCIVASVSYDGATAPTRRLGVLLAYASGMVGLFAGVVSILVASVATRPLKRLARAANELGAGRFDTRVPVEGPAETRQLGRTLSTMASSISTLVQREQTARKEAETANRTKDEFLATLSHELRTPLNAILGWASILSRSGYDRARVEHAVHVIERNARLQSQMIEELLDVSRISAGTVRLNAGTVIVAGIVEAALESIRPAAEAKGVLLSKHFESPNLAIEADPRRLQQVFWNLLSNAVRFTPAGGRVEVTAVRVHDEIELRVSDTGCGIAPEFLPHVFERFRQADSSTTRAHGGLGLGLAIVRDLVDLHGGSVRAESDGFNKGASFIVRLPATLASHVSSAPPSPAAMYRFDGSRVLVVDDDPDTRDVLKAALEGAGAEVLTTSSAGETRRAFAQAPPDLLIADIGMPEEDGYALIASIRQMEGGSSHVPAIALTARTRPEEVEQVLAAGFQVHLPKPIDARRLLESIASLVSPSV